jgi:hypothetical protein
MLDEHPRPGDTIEVTWNHPDWLGKILVVVECPELHRHTSMDQPSHAWFSDDRGRSAYFRSGEYKIVARGNGHTLTNSEIDRSLDRQRDDNLRGVFT